MGLIKTLGVLLIEPLRTPGVLVRIGAGESHDTGREQQAGRSMFNIA
jgi:hypothetical protein